MNRLGLAFGVVGIYALGSAIAAFLGYDVVSWILPVVTACSVGMMVLSVLRYRRRVDAARIAIVQFGLGLTLLAFVVTEARVIREDYVGIARIGVVSLLVVLVFILRWLGADRSTSPRPKQEI
jgi:hypothetical protein